WRHGKRFQQCLMCADLWLTVGCRATVLICRTSTGRPVSMSVAFLGGTSPLTYQSFSRPSSNWLSTERLPNCLVSASRPICFRLPMRRSSDDAVCCAVALAGQARDGRQVYEI